MTSPANAIRTRTVVNENGCHIWTGARDNQGYGKVSVGGRTLYAHRVAYERAVGPIPEGRHLDHLCRIPACVNPAHLEPVTPKVNYERSTSRAVLMARGATEPERLPLRRLRREADLSLTELARRAGVSKGLVSLWERERYVPTEAERVAIMAVLEAALITDESDIIGSGIA